MQDTGDVLYRVSGVVMVMSGLLNAFVSLMYILSLIWVCVGAFWLIPLVLAGVDILVGIGMIATGRQIRPAAFAPILGLGASFCNLNFMGMMLDVIALGLGIGGFVASSQNALEERR